MPGEKQGEIREVFEGLTKMMLSLKEPMRELIEYVNKETSGEKLGLEAAAFYSSLIDKGVPEDLAREMTRDYLRERLSLFKSIIEKIGTVNMPGGSKNTPPIIIKKEDETEKKGEKQ
jgi:hypothetical protein